MTLKQESLGLGFSRLLRGGSGSFPLLIRALGNEVAPLAAVVAGAAAVTSRPLSATVQRSSRAAACIVTSWSIVAAAVTLSAAAKSMKTAVAAA